MSGSCFIGNGKMVMVTLQFQWEMVNGEGYMGNHQLKMAIYSWFTDWMLIFWVPYSWIFINSTSIYGQYPLVIKYGWLENPRTELKFLAGKIGHIYGPFSTTPSLIAERYPGNGEW